MASWNMYIERSYHSHLKKRNWKKKNIYLTEDTSSQQVETLLPIPMSYENIAIGGILKLVTEAIEEIL